MPLPERTILRTFQAEAVESATNVLGSCLADLQRLSPETTSYQRDRNLIVGNKGCLLFEAPTGTGKTLMAGKTAEALSASHRVIWLWVAPFAGVVNQASDVLRAEFPGLRVRNIETDRVAAGLRTGDTYVTTWAGVAVSSPQTRRMRQQSEALLSIDQLLEAARSDGFRIGMVIDEAHHSFRGSSQAFQFYRDVVQPDVTILATATPRDRDIDAFVEATGIAKVNRITVSRQEAVEARLVKRGVKVVVFTEVGVQGLVDLQKTALQQAVRVHRRVKTMLQESGINMTPLMLVQVDSNSGSVGAAMTALTELGFSHTQLRSHTADEPDPHLLALANDETVEVLVFKMAVATGFDAPRAFTLASLRSSRDPDFGVQIVGRIMRIDRRLQVRDDLPLGLEHGYVFLADQRSQTGLTVAAQRINELATQLAQVSNEITVVEVEDGNPSAQKTPGGQTSLLPTPPPDLPELPDTTITTAVPSDQGTLLDLLELEPTSDPASAVDRSDRPASPDVHVYALRSDVNHPSRLLKAVTGLPTSSELLDEIVVRFRFDDDVMNASRQDAATIIRQETEIFAGSKERPERVLAELAPREISKLAQMSLLGADSAGLIDPRQLHSALESAFRGELERRGWSEMLDENKCTEGLHKILALRPTALRRAIDEAVASHIDVQEAATLPVQSRSDVPLEPSRLGLYGVIPADLNRWERAFVDWLEQDFSDTILWWHRNPVRKPWSVSIPLVGQPDFYPDFVVGVRGRNRRDNVLLVETKYQINDPSGNAVAKAQVSHPQYGKVMMALWEDEQRWMTVVYDDVRGMNTVDRIVRPDVMVHY